MPSFARRAPPTVFRATRRRAYAASFICETDAVGGGSRSLEAGAYADAIQRQCYDDCRESVATALRSASLDPSWANSAFVACLQRVDTAHESESFHEEARRGLEAAKAAPEAQAAGALSESVIAAHVALELSRGVASTLAAARRDLERRVGSARERLERRPAEPAAFVGRDRSLARIGGASERISQAFDLCERRLARLTPHLERSVKSAHRSLLIASLPADQPGFPFFLAADVSRRVDEPVFDSSRLEYALHAKYEDGNTAEASAYDVSTAEAIDARRVVALRTMRPNGDPELNASASAESEAWERERDTRKAIDRVVARGVRRAGAYAAAESLCANLPVQALAATGLVLEALKSETYANASAYVKGAGVVASVVAGPALAAKRAGYAYARSMRDDEARLTLLDGRSPVGEIRALVQSRYGPRWRLVFERWATRPAAMPVTTAFRVASAVRAARNRAMLLDLADDDPVADEENVFDAPRGGDRGIELSAARREAKAEQLQHLQAIYADERRAIAAQIGRSVDLREDDVHPGVRCLSALHTSEIDAAVQIYGAYLQGRPRLLGGEDAAARSDRLLAAQFWCHRVGAARVARPEIRAVAAQAPGPHNV